MSPILVAFGLAAGAVYDVQNGAVRDDIANCGAALEATAKGDDVSISRDDA